LDKLRTDNAEKLEQMRSTVDEKLQVTLETASGRELQAGAPLRIFHNGRYAAGGCRRQIEKSPLAQIEMSLSPVFESDGELAADDGDFDEPFGDRSDECTARSG
jgi:hypothetical protein